MSAARGRTHPLPNVWGEGVLFAFSALDGPTDLRTELVATTLGDEPGFQIRYPSEGTFRPRFLVDGRAVEKPLAWAEFRLVCGDAIDVRLLLADDVAVRLRYAAVDNETFAGEISREIAREIAGEIVRESGGAVLVVELELSAAGHASPVRTMFLGEGDPVRRCVDEGARAVFAITAGDAPRTLDFEAAFQHRKAFFESLPVPDGCDERTARTLLKCFSVLKVNVQSAQGDLRHRWCTPDRYPHRHMWLWDTPFEVIGLKHVAPKAAEEAIRAVLAKQRADGFIPHMMTPDDARDSTITQSPLLCWAVWHLFESSGERAFLRDGPAFLRDDRAFLRDVFARLVTYVRRFLAMDGNGNGLLEWRDGGFESGMDNSPRFDTTRQPDAVDLNAFVAKELACLGRIAGEIGEAETAAWCARERDRLARCLNERLWHDEDGIYYDLDPQGEHVRVKTAAAFVPLFAGVVPAERLERLVAHLTDPAEFSRPFPVSTVAADEPAYCDDMWRGPTWANVNYLVVDGLRRYGRRAEADHIARRTIEEIVRVYHDEGVIFEFYDAEAARSPRALHRKGAVGGGWLHTCVKDYGWTAVVFVELVLGRRSA